MAIITWLHLSDWHQGDPRFDRDVVCDALLKDIRERATIDPALKDLDFVFFTGDLSGQGTAAQLAQATDGFLQRVLAEAGVKASQLFLVPGNHDQDWKLHRRLPVQLSTPFADEAAAHDWFYEAELRGDLVRPFSAYEAVVGRLGAGGFGSYGDARVVEVRGVKVGIAGLNSALTCARRKDPKGEPDDKGVLTAGEHQAKMALDKLAEADVRIGLMHHPFDWLADFDRNKVEARMRKDCDFILRGHAHNASVEKVSGTQGECVVVPAGSSFEKRNADRPLYTNAYNYVRYDTETGAGVVFLRCWSDKKDAWREDVDTAALGGYPFTLTVAAPKPAAPARSRSNARKPAAALDLDAIRTRYLQYVRDRWENLETRGVMDASKLGALPLDQVYVSLTGEREVREMVLHVPPLAVRTAAGGGDDTQRDPARRGEEDAECDPMSGIERRTRVGRLPLPQALRESQHVVVLGDPGAGKTVLTRYLARHFAAAALAARESVLVTPPLIPVPEGAAPDEPADEDYGRACLPILVRVSEYAEALRGNGACRLSDFLHTARKESGLSESEATALFERALADGTALVILDGLDEVTGDAARADIARKVDDFALGVGGKSRVLVTSRIVGYQTCRLGPGFAQVTLCDMDREQIGRFVRRREVAYQRMQSPGLADASIAAIAQPDIDQILAAIDKDDGVRRLAVNPLLLFVLCIIQRAGKRLPDRRVELYEEASRALLEGWRLAQAGPDARVVRMPEADALLAPLAFWMHANKDTGLITRAEAEEQLRRICAEQEHLPPRSAAVGERVEDFWRRLCHDCGLMVERGEGTFAFLHLTFEEYWAARYLVADFSRAPALIRGLRHRSRWQEVIRLAVASRTKADAATLIRAAIWNPDGPDGATGYEPSEHEDILHRDLLLAARCLGDCEAHDAALGAAAADALVPMCLQPRHFNEAKPLADAAAEALAALRHTPAGQRALQALLGAMHDESRLVRQAAAQALGSVGQGSAEALQALLSAMRDRDASVRWAAARALGSVGQGSAEVLQAVLAALGDNDGKVRQAAAWALGPVGQGSAAALKAALAALRDNDVNVRYAAGEASGSLGQGSAEALQVLLAAMRENDGKVRQAAAWALGPVGQGSAEALQALLAAMRDDHLGVRGAATRALGSVGQGSAEALQALLAALRDDDPSVRFAAARALGMVGQGSAEALRALLAALQDGDPSVLCPAAQALGSVGQGSAEALQALLAALRHASSTVRQAAAWALGSVGQGSAEVLQALLAAMRDGDPSVQWAAARALGPVGQGSPEALQAVRAAVRNEDSLVCDAAWTSLRTLVQAQEDAADVPGVEF